MFNRKTVFVIGAGCSKEFNLPLGWELRNSIHVALTAGDPTAHEIVSEAFHRLRIAPPSGNRNAFFRAFADGLHTKASIDQYLDFHRNNPAMVALGKVAIAYCILAAERRSLLNVGEVRTNFPALAETWLGRLFQCMNAGTDISRSSDIFKNITFICFNYDRCIEVMLFNALQRLTHWDIPTTLNALKKLEVLHPYGTVGEPPKGTAAGVDCTLGFPAQRIDPLEVADGSGRLRTFTEGMEDEGCRDRIQGAVSTAEQVIFLGFSYLEQNMEILRIQTDRSQWRLYGSTLGLSPPDTEIAKHRIAGIVQHPRLTASHFIQTVKVEPVRAAQMMGDWGNTFQS